MPGLLLRGRYNSLGFSTVDGDFQPSPRPLASNQSITFSVLLLLCCYVQQELHCDFDLDFQRETVVGATSTCAHGSCTTYKLVCHDYV